MVLYQTMKQKKGENYAAKLFEHTFISSLETP